MSVLSRSVPARSRLSVREGFAVFRSLSAATRLSRSYEPAAFTEGTVNPNAMSITAAKIATMVLFMFFSLLEILRWGNLEPFKKT
jgi:hypothetical protein